MLTSLSRLVGPQLNSKFFTSVIFLGDSQWAGVSESPQQSLGSSHLTTAVHLCSRLCARFGRSPLDLYSYLRMCILPTAVYGFYTTDESDHPLAGLLGLLSSFQWLFILVLPLVQASVRMCTFMSACLSAFVGGQSD